MLTKSRWSTLIATAALVLATSVAQAQSPAPTAPDAWIKQMSGEVIETESAIVLETLISQFLYSKAADASDAPAAKP